MVFSLCMLLICFLSPYIQVFVNVALSAMHSWTCGKLHHQLH